jgi:hypothetical protein
LITAALAAKLADEVDQIVNQWERANYLYTRAGRSLWSASVKKYVVDTKFPLLQVGASGHGSYTEMTALDHELKEKYNLELKCFKVHHGNTGKFTCADAWISTFNIKGDDGVLYHRTGRKITAHKDTSFIINDTKKGSVARAKHHYRETKKTTNADTVYVLEQADRTKTMDAV